MDVARKAEEEENNLKVKVAAVTPKFKGFGSTMEETKEPHPLSKAEYEDNDRLSFTDEDEEDI